MLPMKVTTPTGLPTERHAGRAGGMRARRPEPERFEVELPKGRCIRVNAQVGIKVLVPTMVM
jgi:hypothetical protein